MAAVTASPPHRMISVALLALLMAATCVAAYRPRLFKPFCHKGQGAACPGSGCVADNTVPAVEITGGFGVLIYGKNSIKLEYTDKCFAEGNESTGVIAVARNCKKCKRTFFGKGSVFRNVPPMSSIRYSAPQAADQAADSCTTSVCFYAADDKFAMEKPAPAPIAKQCVSKFDQCSLCSYEPLEVTLPGPGCWNAEKVFLEEVSKQPNSGAIRKKFSKKLLKALTVATADYCEPDSSIPALPDVFNNICQDVSGGKWKLLEGFVSGYQSFEAGLTLATAQSARLSEDVKQASTTAVVWLSGSFCTRLGITPQSNDDAWFVASCMAVDEPLPAGMSGKGKIGKADDMWH